MMSTKAMIDPRESMRNLPQWLQPFLTWMTGKPYQGQPYRERSSWFHFNWAFFSFLFGMILSIIGVSQGGLSYGWVFLGWIPLLFGARTLQVMILHQCAHRTFFQNEKFDDLLGTWIARILFIENYKLYREKHCKGHHGNHMTMKDPTVYFLIKKLKICSSMSLKRIWLQVIVKVCSPFFQIRMVVERILSHYQCSWKDGLLITLLHSSFLFFVIFLNWVEYYLLCWVLPMTLFYNTSSCFRLCIEHLWPEEDGEIQNLEKRPTEFTTGIFMGSPAPASSLQGGKKWGAWGLWGITMLFFHLPCRLLLMVGDTPCHDFHHQNPRCLQWQNFEFMRHQDSLENQDPLAYQEIWGVINALNQAFESIGKSKLSLLQ